MHSRLALPTPQEQVRLSTGSSIMLPRIRPGVRSRTFESIVELIGHTTTATGLRVKAKLDKARYATGRVVPHAEMRALSVPW